MALHHQELANEVDKILRLETDEVDNGTSSEVALALQNHSSKISHDSTQRDLLALLEQNTSHLTVAGIHQQLMRFRVRPLMLQILPEPGAKEDLAGPWTGGGAHDNLDFALMSVFLVFAALGVQDVTRFRVLTEKLAEAKEKEANDTPAVTKSSADNNKLDEVRRTEAGAESSKSEMWSVPGLMGLTCYRFYTGFLSATWLPYLLAMEGEDLWRENQSLFMGVAKLIYGATILINPIMGRLGDRAVGVSHGLGRRIFVRVGISVSATGIFICLAAARQHMFYPFLLGILVWRLGEAINDITTEAIIPEMVPPEQWPVAGAVKAASFLFGGLFGYVLLILLVNLHYSWLYYAYMVGMLICALPALYLLRKDEHPPGFKPRGVDESLWDSITQAYVVPTQYEGGFPRFSLCTFVFTLGTSPMFFLLLMVRDLVGVSDPADLQRLFSQISIVFFISAAVASILSGIGAPKVNRGGQGNSAQNSAEEDQELKELKAYRWNCLVKTEIVFALVVFLTPCVVLFGDTESKTKFFFAFSVLFGATFGSGYARFQDAVWQVLPSQDMGQANAMGFNTMCRLLGIGIGNFVAGLMLDFFYTGKPMQHYQPSMSSHRSALESLYEWLEAQQGSNQVYRTEGYVLMCTTCAACNLFSAYLTRGIKMDHALGCRTPG